MFEHTFEIDATVSEAELREVVAHCERLKASAAAAQARATALWAAKRRATENAAGIPARKRGRGLASEIALARLDAPVNGNTHLGMANALVHEMPHTLAALEAGVLTEYRATLIVKASACLTVEDRRALDAELCADQQALVGLGNARIEAAAAAIAARLDAAAVVERKNRAAQSAGAWTRCAPNGMVYLTFLMPLSRGVGVYAALKREADATGDGRPRGQVMTDTLYERVTGRPADKPAPIALNLVLADTTLFGEDDAPGWIQGYGPVPAVVVRDLVSDAVTDEDAKATLRRLYRHPTSGQLVAMESKARIFPKGLAAFIGLRDQTCRTPYCNAPIRHHDHATPHHKGGPTSAGNGAGSCEACNYTKEAPGWTVRTHDSDGRHTAEYTTPTGATYHSTAPPLPGPTRRHSVIEGRLSIDIVELKRTA
ncbi:HNH endonuclease signature motif containing protein [Mycolicibacterium psychrotolerans]|uniref:HNH endonuclease n=1 Tax=Mycolicibacterium psychrotolerans TaxID=216929 RepID=A0A7I7MDW6_9MYCO|nr:HNH endonuclease signature motif containing protein [Mycolicibacterium psychrotolerans]BBX69579.1 HNH endonuclease [Mycolicibacterium psychrotolerans]